MKRIVVFLCFGLAATSSLVAKEPSVRRTLTGHTNYVESVVFSPDGETLVSAAADGTARLWSLETGQNLATVGDDSWIGCLAFNGENTALATMWGSGVDGLTIDLWDVATRKKIVVMDRSGQTDDRAKRDNSFSIPHLANKLAAFSCDAKMLAWSTEDGSMVLWETMTGKRTGVLRTGCSSAATVVTFSPDGKTLAAASNGTITLWDLTTGKSFHTIAVHVYVPAMAFSPDGKMLAVSREAPSLQPAPAGMSPSTDTDSTITLWDTATGKSVATLSGHFLYTFTLAFSPDGTTLASGGQDTTIKLWDVATGKNTALLRSHTGPVLAVAFSRDGATLASGSGDDTIKLWDMPSKRSSPQARVPRTGEKGGKGGRESAGQSRQGGN